MDSSLIICTARDVASELMYMKWSKLFRSSAERTGRCACWSSGIPENFGTRFVHKHGKRGNRQISGTLSFNNLNVCLFR
jgi:hypothetical protein